MHLRKLFTTPLACAVVVAVSCSEPRNPTGPDAETIAKGTITARPAAPTLSARFGYSELGLADPRDGFLFIPPSYSSSTPAPLLVLLHGAGGDDSMWRTASIEAAAETHGLIILATESRYDTWDGIQLLRYDPDVAFLNSALLHVFARVNIDPNRVWIGGFSDGASEALGIGIMNAGLFTKIVAFTPGTLNPPFSRGNPEVFLSHGLSDQVIPFGTSRDFIVPGLRGNGMNVLFYIFEGGHFIPTEAESAAFDWLFDIE